MRSKTSRQGKPGGHMIQRETEVKRKYLYVAICYVLYGQSRGRY